MDEGITLEEACSLGVVGTKEDFELNCNEDGTVKERPETTTFSIKGHPDKSITVNDAHLQIAIIAIPVLILLVVALIIYKIRKRRTKRVK